MEENDNVTSEKVLAWARIVQVQKAHSAILENINETKDIDKIFARNRVQKQNEMQLQECTRILVRQRYKHCGSIYPPRKCLAYGKMCAACGKISHFKEVCRSDRNKRWHSIDQQEEQHQDKDNIDKVNISSININFITLNSKCSVITVNSNTSSQATSVVSYKVDSGSDGNNAFSYFKIIIPQVNKRTISNEK